MIVDSRDYMQGKDRSFWKFGITGRGKIDDCGYSGLQAGER